MNKTIRYAGHSWRNSDELISEVFAYVPTYQRTYVGWPGKTYIHQLYPDTECWLEDQPIGMDRERERNPREFMLSAQLDDIYI